MTVAEKGFTIIELMIATAIFAVILVLTSTTIIGISDTYIKGSVEGQTQEGTRTILSDISEDFQINGNGGYTPVQSYSMPNGVTGYWFCLGTDVYVYNIGSYLSATVGSTDNPSNPWALVRYQAACPQSSTDIPANPEQDSVAPPDNHPEELLVKNERILSLNISQVSYPVAYVGLNSYTNAYTIEVTVAYADNVNLLTGTGSNTGCVGGPDTSFCSVSSLTTTVAPVVL